MPLTVIKTLPHPWKVGGQEVTEIEVRPPLLKDLLEAETEANPGLAPNSFHVAMACRQIVRAGAFTGPFTKGQFLDMKPAVWWVIRDALEEADKLGEDVPRSQEATT